VEGPDGAGHVLGVAGEAHHGGPQAHRCGAHARGQRQGQRLRGAEGAGGWGRGPLRAYFGLAIPRLQCPKGALAWPCGNNISVCLCHCATVPLCHCATVSLCHCATVSLCHCATGSLSPACRRGTRHATPLCAPACRRCRRRPFCCPAASVWLPQRASHSCIK